MATRRGRSSQNRRATGASRISEPLPALPGSRLWNAERPIAELERRSPSDRTWRERRSRSRGRTQVVLGAELLKALIPCLRDSIEYNIDQDWSEPPFPRVGSAPDEKCPLPWLSVSEGPAQGTSVITGDELVALPAHESLPTPKEMLSPKAAPAEDKRDRAHSESGFRFRRRLQRRAAQEPARLPFAPLAARSAL